VLEPTIPPGEATLEHLHTHDDVTVCIGGSAVRSKRHEGEWGASGAPCVPGTANISEYAGKPSSHTVQNTGAGTFRLLAIENLHMGGWANPEPLRTPGVELVKEGRAFRIYAVDLAGGSEVSHAHQTPAVIVVVSGRVQAGQARLDAPGRWAVVPAGEARRVVASEGGARFLEIEVR